MREFASSPPASGSVAALLVAAGRGVRAGAGGPKQYRMLAGRPVLAWSLEVFLAHPRMNQVRVVINPDDAGTYAAIAASVAGAEKLGPPIPGGAERQDSVRLGLEALAAETPPSHVLIHDAARPLVTAEILDGVLAQLTQTPGAVPAIPVADTLKRARDRDPALIAETTPREGLWRAQTPQGFHFTPLLHAHRQAQGVALTDDAAVAERAKLAVALTPGADFNLKLTTPHDFIIAEALLAARGAPPSRNTSARDGSGAGASESPQAPAQAYEFRTGQGFDVHAFAEGDHVMLCGVRVEHDRGLSGHSDADVALHALTDALLGAGGLGDIGDHFPPSDPHWRGADSAVFLKHALELLKSAGGAAVHVDLTLICERPKIGPQRAAMVARVAELMGLASGRVSVKATTTERLGFTGRREGVAALATATVRFPMDPSDDGLSS